jgi:hypothetical protein
MSVIDKNTPAAALSIQDQGAPKQGQSEPLDCSAEFSLGPQMCGGETRSPLRSLQAL